MSWKNFPDLGRQGQITYLTMQDGTSLRTASWPAQEGSRGIIVLVNGYREYMEKYSEFIGEFLQRGFALYTLDNRGQGLSDRLLPGRFRSHSEGFGLFSSDLQEVISRLVMSDPRAKELPLYLVGHSMGGHICLRYMHDFPGIIDKAVLMAPMIEFRLGGEIVRNISKFLIRLACRAGFKRHFAFGQSAKHSEASYSKKRDYIRQKLLTHDKKRYAVEADIISANPGLYVGGSTFGWLNCALDSIQKIQKPGFIAAITVPILGILAGDDQVVDSQASVKYLSGNDNIRLVTIQDARHEIYREIDEYREQLWQKIDGFLCFK